MSKPKPEPERLTVKLPEVEITERDDGQFEYQAIAQFYNVVNDRMMVFRRGAFAKTLEGLGTGRVKINDSHIRNIKTTAGTVIEARETDVGLWYRGLLSSTSGELVTKMREGHIDENSIEFYPIQESTCRMPLSSVPEGSYYSDRSTGDGTIECREMLECSWVGIALCPASSQRRRALLDSAVPFQDLPVASASGWDPVAAAARVAEWAGIVRRSGDASAPNMARLSRAYLLHSLSADGSQGLIGQIADVVDGDLVVIPEALESALDELAAAEHLTGADLAAASHALGRYAEKLRRLDKSPHAGAPSSTNNAQLAGPVASEQPPTTPRRSDTAAGILAGHHLALLSLRLEAVAAKHPEVRQ